MLVAIGGQLLRGNLCFANCPSLKTHLWALRWNFAFLQTPLLPEILLILFWLSLTLDGRLKLCLNITSLAGERGQWPRGSQYRGRRGIRAWHLPLCPPAARKEASCWWCWGFTWNSRCSWPLPQCLPTKSWARNSCWQVELLLHPQPLRVHCLFFCFTSSLFPSPAFLESLMRV